MTFYYWWLKSNCLAHLASVSRRCEYCDIAHHWKSVYPNFIIGDSSNISHHLYKLWEKEVKSILNDACLKVFECMKEKLTSSPIIILPDCSMPFEIMYDANGMELGVVLFQRHDMILHSIYYVSKALSLAPKNYTMM